MPGLARDQHRALRRGDPGDPLVDLAHPGALAEEVVERVLVADAPPERADLVLELAVGQGLLDQDLEPVDVDGLVDEVVGAELHRLDGRRDRGVAGHQDRRDRQVAVVDLADQVEAVDPRELEVDQDEREVPLDQPLQGRGPVVDDLDPPIRPGQQLRELLADRLAIVHHEDASIHDASIHW